MKIGNNFEVQEKYKKDEVVDIGGYKVIISTEEGVLIQGISLVNLFELPITDISITPLDEEIQGAIKDFPFDKEKHHLVYAIGFNGKVWYFNKREEAFALMNVILQTKEHGLHQKFIENIRGKSE